MNVPLGCIRHVEKMGRSRNKGEHAYGLEIHCKVKVCIVVEPLNNGHVESSLSINREMVTLQRLKMY